MIVFYKLSSNELIIDFAPFDSNFHASTIKTTTKVNKFPNSFI